MKNIIDNYIIESNYTIKEIIKLDSKDSNYIYCIVENNNEYIIERARIVDEY